MIAVTLIPIWQIYSVKTAPNGYNSSYATDYTSDLNTKDELDKTVLDRANLYNPMYYLNDKYDGYNTSNVAKHWRIRTGITQGDTALTTETNLMLALKNDPQVSDVDFATVWGITHVQTERTGSSTTNFIDWVNSLS